MRSLDAEQNTSPEVKRATGRVNALYGRLPLAVPHCDGADQRRPSTRRGGRKRITAHAALTRGRAIKMSEQSIA